jgi:hypothetical protein
VYIRAPFEKCLAAALATLYLRLTWPSGFWSHFAVELIFEEVKKKKKYKR